MISFKNWLMRDNKISVLSEDKITGMHIGWTAALEAVMNNKEIDQAKYLIEDNEIAKGLAVKLANSKPGEIVLVTPAELNEYQFMVKL